MPGLTVYRSNRLEVLATALASHLRADPPSDPCTPLQVVVGNRGMERWLRHQLAQHLGICANLTFPFPTTVLDQALELLAGPPDAAPPAPAAAAAPAPARPWDPDVLTWAILEVLPALLPTPTFAPVRAYLDDDPDAVISPRRHALARQLADICDRYVTYRPELAHALSAGQPPPAGPLRQTLAWQVDLWRALDARFGPTAPHRATRLAQAEARLRRGDPVPPLPGPIRIFGVSTLPSSYLDLIGLLSGVVAVELYLLCPSDQYWADLHSKRAPLALWRPDEPDDITTSLRERGLITDDGPPLLTSFGRVARDFQILLESQPDGYEDRRVEAFYPPADPTRALGHLQRDLLELAAPQTNVAPLAPGDDSLQLHACHGPTRQVEVLRDVLLGLFDDHPQLQPRDVLVLTPDLDRFAPLVSAVFGDGAPEPRADGSWGPAGAPQIPFEITDQSARQTNPVAATLLRLLELATGRLEAPAVLDLLGLDPVRRRFDLAADDLPRLATWVRESGARWGLDAAHRHESGQPADKANTWRFGLERLLLGVTLAADDDARLFAGLAPVDDVEGQEVALLGKLAAYVATLVAELEALRAPRPLGAWVTTLDGAISRLTAVEPRAAWLTRRVREALTALATAGTLAGSALPITVEALRAELTSRLTQPSGGDRQQTGAVTFSAMVPMRSIPYRVVVLLGLDDGAFPRSTPGLAFDLTQLKPRIGDRNPRDEDRYLFLEALLAAREHLVILYTGRSLTTNEPLAPAVPVSELCEVLDASFTTAPGAPKASARLTTVHPLQPFSPHAFAPHHRDPHHPDTLRPWSFDSRLLSGALAARAERAVPPLFGAGVAPTVRAGETPATPAPPTGTGGVSAPLGVRTSRAGETPAAPATATAPAPARRERLDLGTLVRFLARPTRHLVRTVLKTYLDERDEAVLAREPIDLDPLARWQLGDRLLHDALAGRGPDAALAALRGVGGLPLGYAGEAQVRAPWAVAEALRDRAADLVDAPVPWPDPDAPVAPIAPIAIDLAFDDLVLTGQLTDTRGLDLVKVMTGALSGRRLLAPWVELLAWRAQGAPPTTSALLVGGTTKRGAPAVEVLQLLPDPAAVDPTAVAARAALANLIDLYRAGTRSPLPLFPEASHTFAWNLRKLPFGPDDFPPGDHAALHNADVRDALDKAQDAFAAQDGAMGSRGDLDDVYVRTLYPDGFPFLATAGPDGDAACTFARLALTVWGPLFQARRTEGQLIPAAARQGGSRA